ncbi:MarR family winged helix-turn-helix transcriptional regulator [Parasphingopyxis marina]|uniref:MarR family transcriptional regulator n=1 Tax=Parasphingopyxis marina TaxID=2761622 RepID=A0A842HVM5_9SPHN|nr:MarR family transcriptional regulator [Parasphingopyxis marina]MBC2776000.1 MarR family transcriptional regulator [Parasphingopyxis marina]
MATNRKAAAKDAGSITDAWQIFGPKHILYRILMVGKALDRIGAQQVRDSADISLAEWRVMAHLGRLGETSASELSAAAQVDRAEVSRAVNSLAKRDFIRKRPNPANRLSQLLSLTETGEEVFDRVFAERQQFFQSITADLSREELRELDDRLYRIAGKIDEFVENQ